MNYNCKHTTQLQLAKNMHNIKTTQHQYRRLEVSVRNSLDVVHKMTAAKTRKDVRNWRSAWDNNIDNSNNSHSSSNNNNNTAAKTRKDVRHWRSAWGEAERRPPRQNTARVNNVDCGI